MNTKLLLLWLVLFLFVPVVISYAEPTENETNWGDIGDRSICLFLSIEYDELQVYSDNQWDNVSIQIINQIGITIYSDVINIPVEEQLFIQIPNISNGNYQVILTKNNHPIVWFMTK